MAQTLIKYETPVVHRGGHRYRAQACGRQQKTGMWEAWLEFVDMETGEVYRSERETTQPNRTDAEYWATGLSPVYLEGALDRILNPPLPKVVETVPPPHFDGPARRPRPSTVPSTDPVLDPFSVYEKNPDVLAQQLTALRAFHLRQIIRHFDLVDEDDIRLDALTEPELGSLIMRRVRELHP
jgi:hypothetical protein